MSCYGEDRAECESKSVESVSPLPTLIYDHRFWVVTERYEIVDESGGNELPLKGGWTQP